MEKIKCIIVDDEELAREGLRFMLAEDRRFELVATCADGLTAIEQIEQLRPDLVFLDVQMPGVNGMEVIASLSKPRPYIIFTTAFEQYAIKAFEVNAIDYLLKPFSDERLDKAIQRAIARIHDKKPQDFDSLVTHTKRDLTTPDLRHADSTRLVLKAEGRIQIINTHDIIQVEAFDYYVKIHLSDRFILIRETMQNMENQLKSPEFMRTHKSHILHKAHVKEFSRGPGNNYMIITSNDQVTKVSRSKVNVIKEWLK